MVDGRLTVCMIGGDILEERMAPYSPWTAAMDETLLRLRRNGLKFSAVSAAMNVPIGSALNRAKFLRTRDPSKPFVRAAMNINGQPVLHPWTPDRDDKVRELAASGVSKANIAVALDVSKGRVQQRMRTLRVKVTQDVAGVAMLLPHLPKSAGHPVTWGAITAGTILAGEPYPQF